MSHHNPYSFRPILWLSALFGAFLSPATGKSPASGKDKPLMCIVCVSSLNESQEVILAARDAKDAWQELGKTSLRASMITDWLPARAGELHFAEQSGGTLKSIGHFTYPKNSSRGLVILVANPATKTYNAQFVDPKKAKFKKGSFLIYNFSAQPASVFLGPNEHKIEAGHHAVAKPTLEGNGMFRMQVTRPGKDNLSEACYDRYTPANQDSHSVICLLPDEKSGLRVVSLPLFSEIE
jgi:hypothetical protein